MDVLLEAGNILQILLFSQHILLSVHSQGYPELPGRWTMWPCDHVTSNLCASSVWAYVMLISPRLEDTIFHSPTLANALFDTLCGSW